MSKLRDKDWKDLLLEGGGSAGGLRKAIAQLAAPDSPRWEAVRPLMDVYGDGHLYSAAAKVVPELQKLLQSSKTQNKDTLLALLAAIVCGSVKTKIVWGVNLNRPKLRNFYSKGVAKEVWESTWAERALYLALLDSDEPMNRSCAALLLAFDFDGANEVHAAVERRLAVEGEPKVTSSLLLCLGLLRSYAQPGKRQFDVNALVSQPTGDPLVRGAATVALLYERGEELELEPTLVDALVTWCKLAPVDADDFPWNNGSIDMLCTRVVEGRCVDGKMAAAEVLAGALRRLGPTPRSDEWASGILELAFE